eukprot:2519372-Rhodomonas_salina.1
MASSRWTKYHAAVPPCDTGSGPGARDSYLTRNTVTMYILISTSGSTQTPRLRLAPTLAGTAGGCSGAAALGSIGWQRQCLPVTVQVS